MTCIGTRLYDLKVYICTELKYSEICGIDIEKIQALFDRLTNVKPVQLKCKTY